MFAAACVTSLPPRDAIRPHHCLVPTSAWSPSTMTSISGHVMMTSDADSMSASWSCCQMSWSGDRCSRRCGGSCCCLAHCCARSCSLSAKWPPCLGVTTWNCCSSSHSSCCCVARSCSDSTSSRRLMLLLPLRCCSLPQPDPCARTTNNTRNT